MKVADMRVQDPKVAMMADLFNKVEDTKKLTERLGEQVLHVVDHVNKTKAYMLCLSYLFSKGVTAFAFQKMILVNPGEVRSYVKTDKGLFAVHVKEENEMMKVESTEFKSEREYYDDMKGWLTLMMEKLPEGNRGEIKKQIEALP